MNESTGIKSAGISGGYSPKKWTELTADEQIERMREQVKNLAGAVSRLQVDLHHIRDSFAKHTHGEKGIVVPYNEYSNANSMLGSASLRNEDYF
jgi:hypothetical protein